ncbi:uncharacterized protein CTRU02_210786 [Colletotrichum truncatum]|uniref:Uncharacterized protein n=1 Tax=Colletotrichum truncatum TaxID=5467 RepID=A0ACC3YQ62_COLTU
MGSQLRQDIRAVLLRIEEESFQDWEDIVQMNYCVPNYITTERYKFANELLSSSNTELNSTNAAADAEPVVEATTAVAGIVVAPPSSSSAGSISVPAAGGIAVSEGAAPARGIAMKILFCTVPGCFCWYQAARSRNRHYQDSHQNLPIPLSSEGVTEVYPQGDAGDEEEES